MKIAFITAGAAGMFCGSCMKDNTLAAALNKLGHDALLIPTYTPIRTDEEDVSQQRVFFGGINVFLQQYSWVFRHTPWLIDRVLDVPRLLRWVSRFAVRTKTEKLGGLTVSMLLGTHGKQRKEVQKLVRFLADDFKPDVILLTNVLLSGIVPAIKAVHNVPILGILQGDDIFLEALPLDDRRRCLELIRTNCQSLSGFFATSVYYADFMAEYLHVERAAMHIVYPGITLKDAPATKDVRATPPFTIGYFARICPEKGFHILVEAYRLLRQRAGAPPCRLRVSGWLGENYRAYFDEQLAKLRAVGLHDEVDHVDSPTHADKMRFMQTLDVLSVPTTYREPKGLYILEALANGVPVVQPRHGAFPELLSATEGGLLVEPNDPKALADGLWAMLHDVEQRCRIAAHAPRVIHECFAAEVMATATATILQQYHQQRPSTT